MSIANNTRVLAQKSAITLTLLCLTAGALPAPVLAAGLPLELVQAGFASPVFVTHATDSRLFVVEQGGLIKIVGGGTFLDISDRVLAGGEQGLLGLAFHPSYASNGLFYVYYTRAGDAANVVSEFHRSAADANAGDPSSERVVLAMSDPYSNHNGGWIGFKGANLYIATGDGGAGGDPENRAQNLNELLGKILKINPLDPDGAGPASYSVPSRNPFVGRSGLDEIWSYGLRNPWRCSFDRATRKLWCADVGQGAFEEVNRHRNGRAVNFGWNRLEGRHYYPSGAICTSSCMKLPIAEYSHDGFGGGNCSVTGGYVARRSGAPLYGNYVFGDYCSGRVWIIPANFGAGGALPEPVEDTPYLISSFGEDAAGRLYLVDHGGAIYRLTET